MVVGIDVSISSSPALFFRFVFYRRGMDVAISGLSRLSSSQSNTAFFFRSFSHRFTYSTLSWGAGQQFLDEAWFLPLSLFLDSTDVCFLGIVLVAGWLSPSSAYLSSIVCSHTFSYGRLSLHILHVRFLGRGGALGAGWLSPSSASRRTHSRHLLLFPFFFKFCRRMGVVIFRFSYALLFVVVFYFVFFFDRCTLHALLVGGASRGF